MAEEGGHVLPRLAGGGVVLVHGVAHQQVRHLAQGPRVGLAGAVAAGGQGGRDVDSTGMGMGSDPPTYKTRGL